MKYNEDDNFLFDMISESNEEVRNSLYEKYKPMIKYIVNKYYLTASKYGLDYNDLIQEANVGFTDALNSYDETKDASLKTFISLCINRKLINAIRKVQTAKNQMELSNLSLDYDYNKEGLPLIDVIGDVNADPLLKFSEKEEETVLLSKIKEDLSTSEQEVFNLLLKGLSYKEIAKILDKNEKQIDNTIQRIRNKVKNILKEK